jgi:hypothetical protein
LRETKRLGDAAKLGLLVVFEHVVGNRHLD